jgi:hypothetical protein
MAQARHKSKTSQDFPALGLAHSKVTPVAGMMLGSKNSMGGNSRFRNSLMANVP